MKLLEAPFDFRLLTPCFGGGAENQTASAELRIPSIRGQVRWWHRTLSDVSVVNRIWGSAAEEGRGSSRVGARFIESTTTQPAMSKPFLLPHKKDRPRDACPRPALAASQEFTLVLQRLVGCTGDDWAEAQRSVRLWLLLGGLGLRSNRAAGSVWPDADGLYSVVVICTSEPPGS